MPRLSTILPLALGTQAGLAIAECNVAGYHATAGGERCWSEGSMFEVECRTQDTGAGCGARVKSDQKFGYGDVAMKIKAAAGAGVATVFYISTNGGVRQAGASWNEVDLEILGGTVRGAQTDIWTNFITGSGVEHGGFVTVPFDATAGEHVYAIRTNMTHLQWLADWVPVRTDSIAVAPDMVAAIRSSKFQTYASVWGKSASEPGVGAPEMVEAMGNLDDNLHPFPLAATFTPAKGAAPGTIAMQQPSAFSQVGGGVAGGVEDFGQVSSKSSPVIWSRFTISCTILSAVFATTVPAMAALISQWRRQDEFFELQDKLERLEAAEGREGFDRRPEES